MEDSDEVQKAYALHPQLHLKGYSNGCAIMSVPHAVDELSSKLRHHFQTSLDGGGTLVMRVLTAVWGLEGGITVTSNDLALCNLLYIIH